ncbi:hypothetical protein GCM10011588_68390 [Nocardia jinanensis]|uniref:Exonuclease domain-containing protein n=1 Tax=Nocardia jinanensis TaxID=382504 RepID=A0A917VZJ4_9NOCA|nr:hypothetical protein GCM10011588_68390 [Nocardia jinanensis]
MKKEHPVGAVRCAARLAERTGLAVEAADIDALLRAGALQVADVYTKRGRRYDLFRPEHIDALTSEQVTPVIDERLAWVAASLAPEDAAAAVGIGVRELATVAHDRQIERGRFGRYARADIEALAAEEDLAEQVRLDRLVTADQAATELLDCARRHFDIAVEAGWVAPKLHHHKEVGRYRTVAVPLYRTGDVEALRELPDIDWEQVRACPKGEKSPLLEIVGGRKASRAQVIRAFLQGFGADHHIEMWGWWVQGPDVWEIDWERIPGGPTKADVEAAIEANPVLRQHRDVIQLHSDVGAAIRFARAMLAPGAAVILDTETTDLYGAVCEIAVIDACTGKTLLDTLVNPGRPIEPGAAAIHGLTDEQVTAPGVPTWPAVYKRLLRITKGRTILAYNANYDRHVIAADCAHHGITRTRLTRSAHWADVMIPRTEHARSYRWLPNGGGHRALGDTLTTREHLQRMTAP